MNMKTRLIKLVKSHAYIYKFCVWGLSRIKDARKKNKIFRKATQIFLRRKEVCRENLSVREYADRGKIEKTILEQEQDRKVYIPKNIPTRLEAQYHISRSKEIYACLLREVIVFPASDYIITDKYCLCDKFELDYKSEFRFETGRLMEYSDDRSIVEVDRRAIHIEKGISLIGEASNNFYHWVFDILPRVLYFNKMKGYDEYPFLIDETVARHSTCVEFLNLVDQKKHKRIFLSGVKSYHIDELLYISPSTWGSVYGSENNKTITKDRYAKSNFVIEEYRKCILSLVEKTHIKAYKRIFITRPGDKSKRLVNEAELSEMAKRYGFVLIEPSMYSLIEQARLFNEAEYIMGASGAAMVNLMWCRKGARVFIASPVKYNDGTYSTIADMVDAECTYLDGIMIDEVRHKIDIESVEKYLKSVLES